MAKLVKARKESETITRNDKLDYDALIDLLAAIVGNWVDSAQDAYKMGNPIAINHKEAELDEWFISQILLTIGVDKDSLCNQARAIALNEE